MTPLRQGSLAAGSGFAAALALSLVLGACSHEGPAPEVRAVSPDAVDTLAGGAVTIAVERLAPGVMLDFDRPSRSQVSLDVTVQLGAGDLRVPVEVNAWRDGALDAVVPPGVALGMYDVIVTDPRGRAGVLPAGLDVVDCLTRECLLPDGGPLDAGPQPCELTTFPDSDLDGFGTGDAGAKLCGPGRSEQGGDCNDGDPLARPSGAEVCNGLDDDCDGVVDDGVCPGGGAAWVRRTDTGANPQDWESAWAWDVGRVWLVGGDDVRVLRGPGGTFSDVSSECPTGLNAVWAEPAEGTAWALGGNNGVGRFARHLAGRDRCEQDVQERDPAAGAVGFTAADGGLDVYVALRDTRMLRWRPAVGVDEIQAEQLTGVQLRDFHGAGLDSLYAVGSAALSDGGLPEMKVFRFELAGRKWVDQRVDRGPPLPPGELRGVWVLGPRELVAVGDRGAVARLSGLTWSSVDALDGGSLTSVRAFSVGRFTTTDDEGHARRWSGQAWEVLFDTGGAAPLRDVTGVSEEDVWAVGHDGWVVHWPR